jgi:hypothetical protein
MPAYFAFHQLSPKGEIKEFVFQLENPKTIAEARAILRDHKTLKSHVQGTIVPRPVSYNSGWSFHLDPASIGFFEMQIEVCDANATFVEEHLGEIGGSFLPKCFWCPWSSKLAAEVSEHHSRDMP